MKQNFMPKIIAAFLLGGLFGWYVHYDSALWNLRGRDALIAEQVHRYTNASAVNRYAPASAPNRPSAI
jgi:hypothetical protein